MKENPNLKKIDSINLKSIAPSITQPLVESKFNYLR